MSGKKIAFFDFDGTITTKDTLLEIIKFQKGKTSFYFGFILHAPWLIAYKLNWLSNNLAKQKILTYFFAGMAEEAFQEKCDLFAEKIIPGIVRPGALTEINVLRSRNFEIVVVSASAANWIRKWSESNSLKLIATKMEVKNGLITGKIEGENNHGVQKAVKIHELWNLNEYEEIYAYGDSSGDKPMMDLATKSFYKPFRSV
ncbi:MAG TPA: HAD family hydrolase [Puia sp.]|nr:HAD family hydrolase [Puia sp.]